MTLMHDADTARKIRMAFAMGKRVEDVRVSANSAGLRHPEEALVPFARNMRGPLQALARRLRKHFDGTENERTNRRHKVTRRVVFEGQEMEVPELARRFRIKPSTLKRRLDKGMSVEEAIRLPVQSPQSGYRAGAARRWETVVGNWTAGELSRLTGVGKRTLMGWNYRGVLDFQLSLMAVCPPFLWALQSPIRDDVAVEELADLRECMEVAEQLRLLSDDCLKPFEYGGDTLFSLGRILELPIGIQKNMKTGIQRRLDEWEEYPMYLELVEGD